MEQEVKKRKGMTLPNKLTMIRILAIPLMIVIYYIPYLKNHFLFDGFSYAYLILLVVFALASLTDFLDGKIARKYNLVTSFGKFADPLADKLLVFTTMTIFMLDSGSLAASAGLSANLLKHLDFVNIVPMWAFSIMLIREFMVSGIRMVAASKGEVIAAGWSGKIKTFETMIALCVCFFAGTCVALFWISHALMIVACVLTLISGIEYLINSRKIIFESI